MDTEKLELISFAALFLGISILVYFVFAPFFQVLIFAAVLAVFFHTPYEKLTRALFGSKSLSALCVALFVLIFLIVPLLLLGWRVFIETQSLLLSLQGTDTHFLQSVQSAISYPLHKIFPNISFTANINQYLETLATFISTKVGVVVTGTFTVILQTLLMLVAFFFFLRDGRKLVATCKKLSPFRPEHTDNLLSHIHQSITSIIKGTLFVALIRWICIGVAFYMLGIPNAVLWGSLGGIVGAIPGLGTTLVFIPAVVYLYVAGNVGAAVGLAIVGVLIGIFIDTLLTTYFFGKGLEEVPSIFVLLSILGGIIFFGPLGFILGPLVLAIFFSILRIYGAKVK